MTVTDIVQQRLIDQHLASPVYKAPADIVYYMGAIQAQDYAGAKWAIAQRLQGAADAAIEKAFTDGDIIRTHVMRPTWHFVHPKDIRWMLELTAPRVQALAKFRHRQLKLDNNIFSLCEKTLQKVLSEKKQLLRDDIATALQHAGVDTNEQRFIHIMMQMELIGLVCSGGREGRQFSYALLDERVPPVKAMDRKDALAELAGRYFVSHGPATIQDYVWWSGLTMADAKAGLEAINDKLVSEILDKNTFWFVRRSDELKDKAPAAFLLPNYDEYIVSYKDRSAAIETKNIKNKADPRGAIFNHTVVINGRIMGIWKRTIGKNRVDIEISSFAPLSKVNQAAVNTAAKRYAKFLDIKDFTLTVV